MSYASQICPIVPTAQCKNQKVVITVTKRAKTPSLITTCAPLADCVLKGRSLTSVGRILFSGKRSHHMVTIGKHPFSCFAQLHTICLQLISAAIGESIKATQPQCDQAQSVYVKMT